MSATAAAGDRLLGRAPLRALLLGRQRASARASRLGLRTRLVAAFTLSTLVLSILLAALAYSIVRENVVRVRERSATDQAFLNGRRLADQLRAGSADPADLLDTLQFPVAASPVLLYEDQVFGDFGTDPGEVLPAELRDDVVAGTPTRMRFSGEEEVSLAVGVPLPEVGASYFEVSSLDEFEETLSEVGYALLGAGTLTTLAGASLGLLVSRRVLRPLAQVRQAAQAIAGGRLDTRLAVDDEADLGALVTSFNDMARALQERIERDARFASDVSHELRSPLTTLAASASILEGRRDELPERAQAALDLLVADLARFSTMVEDLLEISRFDAGAARLDLEPVRVAELVRNALTTSGRRAPVEVSREAARVVVEADKRRLVRVLANLFDNADRYAGGVRRVVVDVGDDGRAVRIAVEDEGPGIAEGDRDRVFERFARGSAEAGRRGTGEGVGLGLALVREHVQLHAGRVRAEAREDGPGARMVVELPVVSGTDEPQVEPDPGPAAVPAAAVDEAQSG